MVRHLTLLVSLPLVLGAYMSGPDPQVRAVALPDEAGIEQLWRAPHDIAARDLYRGPWGEAFAPEPAATYRFRRSTRGGTNPGMIVVDPLNREWSVKQAPHDRSAEGPIEVVLSRVLSAVGYHQPPVYFLPSFSLADTFGTRQEPGGRFRLRHPELKEQAAWDWLNNPFVGTRPYRGLLVMLVMFNSFDLKDSNNSVYEHTTTDGAVERWYVRARPWLGAGHDGTHTSGARRCRSVCGGAVSHRPRRRIRPVRLHRLAPTARARSHHTRGRSLGERSPRATERGAVA